MDYVIDFRNQESKQLLWNKLKGLEGEYLIKIQKKPKSRSIQQNRYYWGVVLEYISQNTGMSAPYLHEIFKSEYIPHVIFIDDYELTTTNLSTDEMKAYIEKIREWALSFLRVRIPEPGEVIL